MNFSYLSPPPAVHSLCHPDSYVHQVIDEKHIRRIFHNLEIIQALRKYLRQHKVNHSFADAELLRFCYAGDFDLGKALQKLNTYQGWMEDRLIQNPSNIALEILEEGIFYSYGRDFEFRPIIVFNIARMDLVKYSLEHYYAALNTLAKPIREHMFVPGKVENWVWIVDTESKLNLPVTSAATVIEKMGAVFSSTLHKLFVVNSSSLIWLMYKGIKGLIHPQTAQKIQVLSSDEMPKLLQFIPADQLQIKFGGKLPDLSVFWPIKSTNKLMFPQPMTIQPSLVQSRLIQIQDMDLRSQYYSIINDDDRFLQQRQIGKCCCNGSSCLLF